MTTNERFEKAWNSFLIYLNRNPKAHLTPFLKEIIAYENRKYKVRITPKRIQNAMYHLRRKYGYFYETVDKTVLYYDSQTRRVKNENYYTEKYGISFIQADE